MPKKILLLSDTHKNLSPVQQILERENGIDLIFHLGDHASDAEKIKELVTVPVYSVCGNCDYSSTDLFLTVTVNGKKILLTHGHQHHVGMNLLRLSLWAQEQGADAVCFGHTHHPCVEYHGSLLMINPGSPSSPRLSSASYATLTVSSEGIFPKIFFL